MIRLSKSELITLICASIRPVDCSDPGVPRLEKLGLLRCGASEHLVFQRYITETGMERVRAACGQTKPKKKE